MLIGYIGLFVVYALSHYWITLNKRDFFSTVLVIILPFVGMYYLGWRALVCCLLSAYIGTKWGLKKMQKKKTVRVSFYDDSDEPQK